MKHGHESEKEGKGVLIQERGNLPMSGIGVGMGIESGVRRGSKLREEDFV